MNLNGIMIINMTSNGINMKNKRIIFSLIGFTLIAILFSEEKQILWDLGVIIQASSQYVESNENPTLSEKVITNNSNIKALISNPFIPPRSIFNEKNILNSQMNSMPINEVFSDNIDQMKLLAAQLSVQAIYQPIINMINHLDVSNLENNDLAELNYWLANALCNTGQYAKAENVLLNNYTSIMNDESHFLLAIIFEHQNKTGSAREEYLKLINKFPSSDYKMAARIKARMLDQH